MHGDAEFVHLVVVLSAEVHAVREDDHREVDRGIDPERGTRESGVPVRVEAHVAADHRLARRAQREAETAAHVVVANELAARVTRELVADDRAVAVHARDRGGVRRRAEETRMPGDAAHREGILVVDFTAQPLLSPLVVALRRDAPLLA